MGKSIFLKVSGEDYSAMEFEDNFDTNDFYKEMKKENVKIKIIDNDDYYFEVEIYEFEEVDPNFEDFVRDTIGDYDSMKGTNFYRVDT